MSLLLPSATLPAFVIVKVVKLVRKWMGPSGFQTTPILRASPIIDANHVKAADVSRSRTMTTKAHIHSPTLTARYRGSIRQEVHIKLLKICDKGEICRARKEKFEVEPITVQPA
jgi:hypothetical protein